jgi:hypothetical protein
MDDNYNFTNITTQTTTIVSTTGSKLIKVIINTPLANGVVTIYNNKVGSGAKLGTITQASVLTAIGPNAVEYGVSMQNGITIVTSGANQDITVVWK